MSARDWWTLQKWRLFLGRRLRRWVTTREALDFVRYFIAWRARTNVRPNIGNFDA